MLTNLGNSSSSKPSMSFNLSQPSATRTNKDLLKDSVNGVIKAIGTVLSFL